MVIEFSYRNIGCFPNWNSDDILWIDSTALALPNATPTSTNPSYFSVPALVQKCLSVCPANKVRRYQML